MLSELKAIYGFGNASGSFTSIQREGLCYHLLPMSTKDVLRVYIPFPRALRVTKSRFLSDTSGCVSNHSISTFLVEVTF